MRIHHIGYLVKHMECAIPAFLPLGYQALETIYDPQKSEAKRS